MVSGLIRTNDREKLEVLRLNGSVVDNYLTNQKVVVVIVNFNGAMDTIECLDSVMRSTHQNTLVIVVDNGSTLEEYDLIRSHPLKPICIRNSRNEGFAKASNIGIRLALRNGADFVLLLNNDATVERDSIRNMVVECSKPNVGIVGPEIRYYYVRNRINSAGGMIHWRAGYIRDVGMNRRVDKFATDSTNRDWISGCAMMIRRDVIETVGLLDDRNFPQGGEDYDYCWRVKSAGYDVMFCPSSVIYHKVSKTRRKIGAEKITSLSKKMGDPKLTLFRKRFAGKYIQFIPYLLYTLIFRQIEVLGYVLVTPDRNLRSYYCSRFISTVSSRIWRTN